MRSTTQTVYVYCTHKTVVLSRSEHHSEHHFGVIYWDVRERLVSLTIRKD